MQRGVTFNHSSFKRAAFGMVMPERAYNAEKYRWGFNGQEHDNELNPSITTATFWEYDGRLGRRWNLDVVMRAGISMYCAFKNNPVILIDPKGDDDFFDKDGSLLASTQTLTNYVRIIDVSSEDFFTAHKIAQERYPNDARLQTSYLKAWSKPIEGMVIDPNDVKRGGNYYTAYKVFNHYQSQIGKTNELDQTTVFFQKNIRSLALSDGPPNRTFINLDENGTLSYLLRDGNNIKSLMFHERRHVDGKQECNSCPTHDELPIYLAQVSDKTFQPTTSDFKEHTIDNIGYYINGIQDKKTQAVWNTKFKEALGGEILYNKTSDKYELQKK